MNKVKLLSQAERGQELGMQKLDMTAWPIALYLEGLIPTDQ